ncbi:hypothetical protein, partial [uncultured Acetatifactor sp.]|uniref:hypothetical protein n=1 Tax=uncultured Acetatifactor sp. TaxID=1671927 RepID=UPI0026F393F8
NRRLRENSEKTEQYRKEYEQLMESAGMLQKKYKKQLDAFDGLSVVYRKELGKLKSEQGK